MTDKEFIQAVNSMYSNINKLRIARYLQDKPKSHALQISADLDLRANYVTQYLKKMKSAQVVTSKRNGLFIEYWLTDFGTRLLIWLL